MFANIKTWVYDRGGKFMYLGGNGINCEIDFLDDATLHFNTQIPGVRTGNLNYVDEEGNVFDSRMHRTYESEATLTGLTTTESGIMTGAPYRAIKTDHWVFEGTGLVRWRHFRPRVTACALPRWRIWSRNRQDEPQLAAEHRASGEGTQS